MLILLFLRKICYNHFKRREDIMKVLLYAEGLKVIGVSGLGKAILHQEKALTDAKVEFTRDEKSTDYDIAHINTYF